MTPGTTPARGCARSSVAHNVRNPSVCLATNLRGRWFESDQLHHPVALDVGMSGLTSAVMRPAAIPACKPEKSTAAEAGWLAWSQQGSVGLLCTGWQIISQIAQATRTALAERAYQQMLVEADFEPT